MGFGRFLERDRSRDESRNGDFEVRIIQKEENIARTLINEETQRLGHESS